MNYWQNIYSHFDPVAFHIGSLAVHWYGMMYVLALLSALWFAKRMIKKDAMPITEKEIDSYFIWVEIGVILGARIGYILFYDPSSLYYITHPWQIFNPFDVEGNFVGIRGMSYHGAIIGAFAATLLFGLRNKKVVYPILDLLALSVPVGYIFGRIGNFLNQELVGKATDVSWGIYVDGVLRHPSQLYEAFLEGVVIAFILFVYRKYKHFDGELIIGYGVLYGIMRFVAEIFREPDVQIGYLCCGLSMGQLMSIVMIIFFISLYIPLKKLSLKYRS
ncbi:MAG: prolipoprotein diacylglyceryl transferase [Sulfurovaceae bacterium]|jgi:phosphatidylglycerol---prolipoprotein diacylglyceryl transferase